MDLLTSLTAVLLMKENFQIRFETTDKIVAVFRNQLIDKDRLLRCLERENIFYYFRIFFYRVVFKRSRFAWITQK